MSTIILRNYQNELIESTLNAWDSDHTNVLIQSHTGSGKTVMLTEIVKRVNVPTVIIAHRMELVSQLSLALARAEIHHGLLTADAIIPDIIKLHLQNLNGKQYFCPTSPIIVVSVDTLVRRSPRWANSIKLVVIDEAAHVLRSNKWGKAFDKFPNADKGLLVTATPMRADGKGLGREGDGVADILIEGPSMRQLIDEGYLSKYRIFAPPNNLDLTPVSITASGDYSPDPLRNAVKKAHITGDIVEHFKRHNAPGALGITFAVSVEMAQELAQAYCDGGIPAVCLHADTGISERASIMRRFREGAIQQLVNVDILTEGVDVPAVSCVSLARPTASYGLHMQQIGRALRPAPGKEHAIILDHVGNITKHGLPDVPRVWTLASQDRKSRSTSVSIPLRTCLNPVCVSVFERNKDRCPYCGHPIPLPKERSTPAQVEGDLQELLPDTISALNKEIARINSAPRIPHGVSAIVESSIIKKHHARQDAQKQLRTAIAEWAGKWHDAGESDSEIQRRFYFTFGIDILTAQTLNAKDAIELFHMLSPDKQINLTSTENKLTNEMINEAPFKDNKYTLKDGGCLYLLISPSHNRYWVFDFSFKNKARKIKIGQYPEVSLDEARRIRNSLREDLKKGIDIYERYKIKKPRTVFRMGNLNRLTKEKIESAKITGEIYKLQDGGCLSLVVNSSGRKVWSFSNGGKKLSLGQYPEISLDEARRLRDKIRTILIKNPNFEELRKHFLIDKLRTE